MNLYELCCEYIEHSNTLEGAKSANQNIYNYCFQYTISINCPKYIEKKLKNHFSKHLK